MQRAYEARDESAFRLAVESVWKWVPHVGSETFHPLKDEKAWKGTNWIYSSLMANLLEGTRLVFLYTEKDEHQRLIPGLYCPSWEIAAYAVMGTGRVRVCLNPKCGRPFIPPSEKESYCTPAHGVAHRTARSRWRKKQRAAKNIKPHVRRLKGE